MQDAKHEWPPAEEAASAMKAAVGARDWAERSWGASRAAAERLAVSTGPQAVQEGSGRNAVITGNVGRAIACSKSEGPFSTQGVLYPGLFTRT